MIYRVDTEFAFDEVVTLSIILELAAASRCSRLEEEVKSSDMMSYDHDNGKARHA